MANEIPTKKECDYCGSENEQAAARCRGCGLSEWKIPVKPAPEPVPARKTEPLNLVIETKGLATTIKCRTPEEAILLMDQLEAADIVPLLADAQSHAASPDAVHRPEIVVSARAYGAARELHDSIEFDFDRIARETPLRPGMRVTAFILGLVPVAGTVLFIGEAGRYKSNGFKRRAHEFSVWFGVGFVIMAGTIVWLVAAGGIAFKPPREPLPVNEGKATTGWSAAKPVYREFP